MNILAMRVIGVTLAVLLLLVGIGMVAPARAGCVISPAHAFVYTGQHPTYSVKCTDTVYSPRWVIGCGTGVSANTGPMVQPLPKNSVSQFTVPSVATNVHGTCNTYFRGKYKTTDTKETAQAAPVGRLKVITDH